VKAPPINGPVTDPMPKVMLSSAAYAGRSLSGIQWAIIIRIPDQIPAPPRPATVLPTIRAFDVGAAPQTIEPTSKMMMEARKVVLTGKRVYSLPNNIWQDATERRYLKRYKIN